MTLKNTRQKSVPWYRRLAFLWPLAIAIIVLAAFLPVVQYGFFNMDDLPLITRNRLLLEYDITDLQAIFSYRLWTPYYKPLVYLSWMIERDLFGISASVLHFNNVLLHALNAVLVFFLIVRMIPKMWPSLTLSHYLIAGFSALIWAIHPFRVESVAWVVERKDVLFGLCYVLACHAWLSHCTREKDWKWLTIATFSFGFACLSKSMAITFPAVAFLLDYFLRRSPRVVMWDKIPLLLMMMVMLYLYGYGFTDAPSVHGTGPMRSASAVPDFFSGLPSVIQHALIANYRLCLFIAHSLIPTHIAIVYPREVFLETIGVWIYILPCLLILLIAMAATKSRRRSVYAFMIAWFIITLSPILSGEGVGTNFISDRYTYLPSMALILAIVVGIHKLCDHIFHTQKSNAQHTVSSITSNTAIVILFILSIGYFIATRFQVHVWRTNLSLWQQAIDNYPGNWYALYNRAKLISDKNPQGAIADLDQALNKMQGLTSLYFARGTILMEQGKIQESIADFEKVIAKEPDHIEARINRGNSYRKLGRHQEAIADYNVVLKIKPKMSKALNNRGLAYLDLGQFENAEQDFTNAVTEKNNYPNPYLNRGNLRIRPEIANYIGAIADFTSYLQFMPQSHEAFFRRGYARLRSGQLNEALVDMNEAIRIYSNEGFYFVGRAQVHESLGNPEEAKQDLQKARSLGVKTEE